MLQVFEKEDTVDTASVVVDGGCPHAMLYGGNAFGISSCAAGIGLLAMKLGSISSPATMDLQVGDVVEAQDDEDGDESLQVLEVEGAADSSEADEIRGGSDAVVNGWYALHMLLRRWYWPSGYEAW